MAWAAKRAFALADDGYRSPPVTHEAATEEGMTMTEARKADQVTGGTAGASACGPASICETV